MNRQPVFYYMQREDLTAAQTDPRGLRHIALSRHRLTGPDDHMVRVAVVEVEPTLLDKAWDAMSPEEQAFLCPPYRAPRCPSAEDVMAAATYLAQQAQAAEKASTSLRAAMEAAL